MQSEKFLTGRDSVNTPPDFQNLKQRAVTNQLALTFAQRAATCLSASIDACNNNDSERADYFSRIALQHTMQMQFY
ncbi:MAG: hypothetical protein EBY20_02830, partial [Alphaproteobacteria bacterium]|nr:hypothetical protein [Alphaproteobacteria bacterium]